MCRAAPARERRAALAPGASAGGAGGTLLVVGHDLLNLTEGSGGPTQADVLFTPDDVVAEIGDLAIEKSLRVQRAVDGGGAARRARRPLGRARRAGGGSGGGAPPPRGPARPARAPPPPAHPLPPPGG